MSGFIGIFIIMFGLAYSYLATILTNKVLVGIISLFAGLLLSGLTILILLIAMYLINFINKKIELVDGKVKNHRKHRMNEKKSNLLIKKRKKSVITFANANLDVTTNLNFNVYFHEKSTLNNEKKVASSTRKMIDSIVSSCKSKIKSICPHESEYMNLKEDAALRILNIINSELSEFEYKKDAYAFSDVFIEKKTIQWVGVTFTEKKYLNCFGFSSIYELIASELKLPLIMIHIPSHVFVRWYFFNSNVTPYINWETTSGQKLDDEYYCEKYSLSRNSLIPIEVDKDGKKMRLSLYFSIIGSGYSENKEYELAEKNYLKAIKISNKNYYANSNLSTIYNALGNNKDAIRYAHDAFNWGPGVDFVKKKLVNAYIQSGITCHNLGNHSESHRFFLDIMNLCIEHYDESLKIILKDEFVELSKKYEHIGDKYTSLKLETFSNKL